MRRMATTALLTIIALMTIFAGTAHADCSSYGGNCPTATVNDSTPANGQTVFISDTGLTPGEAYAIEWGDWRVTGIVPADGVIPFTIPSNAQGSLSLEILGADDVVVAILGLSVETIEAGGGSLPLTGSTTGLPLQLAVGLIGAGSIAVVASRTNRRTVVAERVDV